MANRRRKVPRGPQLELSGALCLAFVNTMSSRPENRQQAIEDYAGLVAWGQQTGALSALDGERLERAAAERAAEAAAVFARVTELRACLGRIFFAVASAKKTPPDDVRTFNHALAAALPALQLVAGETDFAWGWGGDEASLERVLWPVLHSAAKLLVSDERRWVRRCPGRDCGLFFVDRSRTRRRRWCDMKICGNRAKSRRYYHGRGKTLRKEALSLSDFFL